MILWKQTFSLLLLKIYFLNFSVGRNNDNIFALQFNDEGINNNNDNAVTTTKSPSASSSSSEGGATVEACTVCRDKSKVTKPDALLTVPGIGTLPCSAVESLAELVYTVDDADCQLLQSISSICGCTGLFDTTTNNNTTSPCQLCKDGNRVPPSKQQNVLSYLDEIFNYDGINCYLLEAYSESTLESSDLTCQLGQEWVQEYCCSDDEEWVPPTNPCRICVDDDGKDAILDELGTQAFTCTQIQEAALTLWEDSHPSCDRIRTITSLTCNGGRNSNSNSGCDDGDLETTTTTTIESCTLCKDDESSSSSVLLTTPNKVVPFMSNYFFGMEPTCQQLQDVTNLLPLESSECEEIQLLGTYCGCPSSTIKNSCKLCPKSGDSITTPNKRHTNYYELYGQSVTCAQLEAGLLSYDENSDECFLAQETNWECGCNDGFYGYLGTSNKTQKQFLFWISRFSGTLSLFGSIFIIQDFFIRSSKEYRSNIYRRIMVFMSFFDLINGISWILGSSPIPQFDIDGNDTNILGAAGTDATCTAQGFLTMLGYGSGWFNNSLSIYYVLVVVWKWKTAAMQKAQIWLLGIPILLALIQAFAALPYYQHVWIFCWIRPKPFAEHNAAFFFSSLPIIITSIIATACQIRVYLSVRGTFRKSLRWSIHNSQKSTQRQNHSQAMNNSVVLMDDDNDCAALQQPSFYRQLYNKVKNSTLLQNNAEAAVFWQSAFYLFAFFVSWPILLIAVLNVKSQNYIFWMILSFIAPIQGFLNFCVYVRPRIKKWIRRKQKQKRKEKLRRSKLSNTTQLSSTTTTSSSNNKTESIEKKKDPKWSGMKSFPLPAPRRRNEEEEKVADNNEEDPRVSEISIVEPSDLFAKVYPSLS